VVQLRGWKEFYHKDYVYTGKLIGHYYDAHGHPTAALVRFEQLASAGDREAAAQKKLMSEFPLCNSAWAQASGGEVWCSEKSGGVEREWVGRPRILTVRDSGKEAKRCVCVPPGADLNRDDISPYPNCDLGQERCRIPDN